MYIWWRKGDHGSYPRSAIKSLAMCRIMGKEPLTRSVIWSSFLVTPQFWSWSLFLWRKQNKEAISGLRKTVQIKIRVCVSGQGTSQELLFNHLPSAYSTFTAGWTGGSYRLGNASKCRHLFPSMRSPYWPVLWMDMAGVCQAGFNQWFCLYPCWLAVANHITVCL